MVGLLNGFNFGLELRNCLLPAISGKHFEERYGGDWSRSFDPWTSGESVISPSYTHISPTPSGYLHLQVSILQETDDGFYMHQASLVYIMMVFVQWEAPIQGPPISNPTLCRLDKGLSLVQQPHQWRSSSALKTGRREVQGSNPSHACRPSRSEFSFVFSETCVNTGWASLERPPRRAHPL